MTADSTVFDADTAVEAIGEGRFRANLTDRWNIRSGHPNGGYVASFLIRALTIESPFPQPLSMTTHFVDRPAVGNMELAVEVVRQGRSHATLSARLDQDGTPMALALCTFGRLRDGEPERQAAVMPDVPPASLCPRRPPPPFPEMTFADRFDFRLVSEGFIWDGGSGGWMKLLDRALDPVAVPLFMDAWPPPLMLEFGSGLAPTIELTVHWRGTPTSEWHLARFHSRFLQHGYVGEDGELWGEDGRLVAESRQLARFIPS